MHMWSQVERSKILNDRFWNPAFKRWGVDFQQPHCLLVSHRVVIFFSYFHSNGRVLDLWRMKRQTPLFEKNA